MQKTRVWKDSVLRLVYPVRCPVCDEIVADTGQLICPECEPKLKLLLPPWCMKCGKKVESNRNHHYYGITKAALSLVYVF